MSISRPSRSRKRAPIGCWCGGATGRPATDTYKVSLAYRAGYTAAGQLLVYGRDCQTKAQECARLIFQRLRVAGVELEHSQVELLGAGQSVPGLHSPPADLREVLLRISVRDPRARRRRTFYAQIAPLATAGPAGLAGYTAARGTVRPVYAYWPTLVPKELVESVVEIRPASQWATGPSNPNSP